MISSHSPQAPVKFVSLPDASLLRESQTRTVSNSAASLCLSSLPDVLVWIKAVSQGQYPTLHLQSKDALVMNGPEEVLRVFFSMKRRLHLSTEVCLNHSHHSILYKNSKHGLQSCPVKLVSFTAS